MKKKLSFSVFTVIVILIFGFTPKTTKNKICGPGILIVNSSSVYITSYSVKDPYGNTVTKVVTIPAGSTYFVGGGSMGLYQLNLNFPYHIDGRLKATSETTGAVPACSVIWAGSTVAQLNANLRECSQFDFTLSNITSCP